MPELPEVEVVRRGLHNWLIDRTVADVTVLHPRSVRRHLPGATDFVARLAHTRVVEARRRGKYLWLPLDSGDALMAHLGMSGQLLLRPAHEPGERHLRIRVDFTDGQRQLRFVDQRTFGHLLVDKLVDDDAGVPLPSLITHIARDPLDPAFDDDAFAAALLRRRTGLKRALLDQSLVSGIGNIYADEALWQCRLHWAAPTERLRRPQVDALLSAVRDVMTRALAEGGTSFDSLYVNVNGESGYFSRGLRAYGRADLPCERCATLLRREVFMNRSSFSCPKCQPPPEFARF
ncbi:bifunctional DNA-formamidopyrimidine glycosylase/DNA-(apurinic or apyrimidinic site) lyase [Salinactinospora qingdaonensis]|uniref:Formamidopyrimidine-DNA glycosylase n=1 Tax=Salinactinospora qingdaonensis TaxID=702744 RepID=A0ABP7FRW0_9ACTN